jgi:hypothetical protein
MLQKALQIYQTGGESALQAWFESLTREQRQEFARDVKLFLDGLSGPLAGLGQMMAPLVASLTGLFDDLPPGVAPTAGLTTEGPTGPVKSNGK